MPIIKFNTVRRRRGRDHVRQNMNVQSEQKRGNHFELCRISPFLIDLLIKINSKSVEICIIANLIKSSFLLSTQGLGYITYWFGYSWTSLCPSSGLNIYNGVCHRNTWLSIGALSLIPGLFCVFVSEVYFDPGLVVLIGWCICLHVY